MSEARPKLSPLAVIGPGLLVAATGVGAGDLMTASFTGSKLGTGVLWAVVVGALLKYGLNEGIARYQLATGQTVLSGSVQRFGRAVHWLFILVYMLPWSYFVSSALISACGICGQSLFFEFDDPQTGKFVYGVVHSLVALVLVRRGGFAFFEKLMSACIALMFVTVVVTAIALSPDWSAVARGLVVPSIPDIDGRGLTWTVALMGGVGGTLTVLCYGYWIREHGRTDLSSLGTSRIDLAVGYGATALFGIAMVIIGSKLELDGRGAEVVTLLANQLEEPLGTVARQVFLIGAWGAVFSSLLGVWQAVPYLFADLLRHLVPTVAPNGEGLEQGRVFRGFQIAIATVPLVGLRVDFEAVQRLYAVVGAWFMPILALALLFLLGSRRLAAGRNGPIALFGLLATLGFFSWIGLRKLLG